MAATDTTPGTGSIRVRATPRRRAAPARRTASSGCCSAAAFVAILNETTMGVAIPHLIDDLGITALQAQWLTTAFMLTMAVVIPITGFLLQRFTTRQMFVAAMSLFSLGTLIALLAPGLPDAARRARRAGVRHRDHDAAAHDDDHDASCRRTPAAA